MARITAQLPPVPECTCAEWKPKPLYFYPGTEEYPYPIISRAEIHPWPPVEPPVGELQPLSIFVEGLTPEQVDEIRSAAGAYFVVFSSDEIRIETYLI